MKEEGLLNQLFNRYKVKKDEHQIENQITSYRFNPFDRIKLDEPKLSKLLGTLLNKEGAHGQGDLFLRHFLNKLREEEPNKIYDSNDSWLVRAEKKYVDVVLFNEDTKETIIIENKHFGAADQKNQLYRYWYQEVYLKKEINNKESYQIIYLSKDGKKSPVESSISRPKDLENMLPEKLDNNKISFWGFRTQIKEILYSAKTEIPAENRRLRVFLEFYEEILRIRLRGKKIDVNKVFQSLEEWQCYLKSSRHNSPELRSFFQEKNEFNRQFIDHFNEQMEYRFTSFNQDVWRFEVRALRPKKRLDTRFHYVWTLANLEKPQVQFVLMENYLVLRCSQPNYLLNDHQVQIKKCFSSINEIQKFGILKYQSGSKPHLMRFYLNYHEAWRLPHVDKDTLIGYKGFDTNSLIQPLSELMSLLLNSEAVPSLFKKLEVAVEKGSVKSNSR